MGEEKQKSIIENIFLSSKRSLLVSRFFFVIILIEFFIALPLIKLGYTLFGIIVSYGVLIGFFAIDFYYMIQIINYFKHKKVK